MKDLFFDTDAGILNGKLLEGIASINNIIKKRKHTPKELRGQAHTVLRRLFNNYNFNKYISKNNLIVRLTKNNTVERLSYELSDSYYIPLEKRSLYNRLKDSLNYEIKGTTLAELEIESIVNSIK